MSKKTFLVLLGFVFLFSANLAQANLIINEIMYELSGADSINSKSREWVEIYNPDSEINIDASKWRFYDGTANRTINSETNFSIPSLSYVIFAGDKNTFLSDHPGFSGVVYDTGIASLSNTGEILKILDQNLNVVDSVTYASSQGAVGDGNSLQKKSGSWVADLPTPSIQNEIIIVTPPPAQTPSSGGSVTDIPVVNSSVSNTTTETKTESKTKVVEIPKIKTKITSKNLVFRGIPIEFTANATGYNNEPLFYGKYFWNFGDGDSKEIKASDTTKFTHIFPYEGEYTVALEYFQNYYSENPDAIDKINIKIVGTDVSISKVGDEKDFFMEISNNTNYDADLSRWILSSSTKSFTLPNNMILGPKKKTTLSPKITGFSILDKDTLKLMNTQWETVFDYSASVIEPVKILAKNYVPKISKNLNENASAVKSPEGDFTAVLDEQVPVDNLLAAVVKNDAITGNNIMYGIILFSFLGISASGAYFIRSRNRKIIPNKAGDDFEILDE